VYFHVKVSFVGFENFTQFSLQRLQSRQITESIASQTHEVQMRLSAGALVAAGDCDISVPTLTELLATMN